VREGLPFRPSALSERLLARSREERAELWTETVGSRGPVYGERWRTVGERSLRAFDPARSKLAAALGRGWTGPVPRNGERWLYLGAASGTTASHVADLLGPAGRLYAVERSVRPFSRLVAVAERWPNLLPILAEARTPEAYAETVPLVDGIYSDVAQPDQVEIVRRNASYFLRDDTGAIVVALKTSSMGREASAAEHLRAAEAALAQDVPLGPSLRLAPFFRSHFLLGGRRGPAHATAPRDGSRPARRAGPRPYRRVYRPRRP
jgi:fibrillarin-like rRNA methylase